MSEFTSRIDKLLVEKQLRRADLVRATGIPESTIRQWIRSDSIPSADKALKVADFFNVSLEYLLFGTETKKADEIDIQPDEMELIEKYRILDERDKNDLLDIARTKASHYSDSIIKSISIS